MREFFFIPIKAIQRHYWGFWNNKNLALWVYPRFHYWLYCKLYQNLWTKFNIFCSRNVYRASTEKIKIGEIWRYDGKCLKLIFEFWETFNIFYLWLNFCLWDGIKRSPESVLVKCLIFQIDPVFKFLLASSRWTEGFHKIVSTATKWYLGHRLAFYKLRSSLHRNNSCTTNLRLQHSLHN